MRVQCRTQRNALVAALSFFALTVFSACSTSGDARFAKNEDQVNTGVFAARSAMSAPIGLGGESFADAAMMTSATQQNVSQEGQGESEPVERKLIRNANSTVEVDSVDVTIERLVALAEQLGGYVASQNRSLLPDERVRGSVSLRIPGAHVDETLGTIRSLGKIRDERVWVDDVTEEYYDLSIRLDNARDERGKLQEILKQARTVEDLLKVQRELSRVTSEIERMTGRMRRLTNQIEYSTITVEVIEKQRYIADKNTAVGKIVTALGEMVDIFWGTIAAIIRLIGALVPIALLAALVVWIFVLFIRKSRKKNQEKQHS